MRRDILRELPLISFESGSGRSGVSLRAYCRALGFWEGARLTLSSRDGYAVALTAAQAEEAYLVPMDNQSYLLALPSELHRRHWVKDVIEITAEEGNL